MRRPVATAATCHLALLLSIVSAIDSIAVSIDLYICGGAYGVQPDRSAVAPIVARLVSYEKRRKHFLQ